MQSFSLRFDVDFAKYLCYKVLDRKDFQKYELGLRRAQNRSWALVDSAPGSVR